jgi:hypothetical protein
VAVTGVACSTIGLLLAELGTRDDDRPAVCAVLAMSANRRTTQPGLLDALRTSVAAAIRGDPLRGHAAPLPRGMVFLVCYCTTI